MDQMMVPVALLVALTILFSLRVISLIYQIVTTDCKLLLSETCLRTILCIGSGGHTTELLRVMKNVNHKKYLPRLYVVADNDVTSVVKIHKSESGEHKYALIRIPRSRNVKQTYFSSVFSTIYATLYSVPVIYKFKPHVILCNGPGTCVPICVVAFLLRCLFVLNCRIIFIESICRVRTMSLTGKILQYFADVVVVQWPQLRDVCFRAKYFGRLT